MIRLTNLRIFKELLSRDLKIIKKQLPGKAANAGILALLQFFMARFLLPQVGMPDALIAPLYLVVIIQISFFLGYHLALSHVLDLRSPRIIDYYLTLAIDNRWLFGKYVLVLMIEIALLTLPLILAGFMLLPSFFNIWQVNWLGLIAIYSLTLLFFGLFFMMLSFAYPFTWFMDNVWTRRLNPLFLFSAGFFVWKKVYAFSPIFGLIYLCNPITYIVEGLRASLLGGPDYLPLTLCVPMLAFFCVLTAYALRKKIISCLNPV